MENIYTYMATNFVSVCGSMMRERERETTDHPQKEGKINLNRSERDDY